jgi:predicted aldo/keto reductase-like oxidoreductase
LKKVGVNLQKRKLGRTNLEVSVIGFGAMWLPELKADECVKVVKRAIELGINYFDTARNYGDSEEKLGLALQDSRDKCVIASKTGSRTKEESLEHLKKSLEALKTDRMDILQLHGIDDSETLRKALSAGGAIDTCKKARAKGLVDFIGISSHRPKILVEAIKTGEFDVVLVPLNVVTRQPTEELLPLAKEHDVGVVVMKPLAMKVANMLTWKYSPSFSLLSEDPDLATFLGADTTSRVRNALRFILAQDISTIVPGFKNVKEVEVAAKIGEEYKELTLKEENLFKANLENNHCRDCGLCLPCPRKLNIPAILRFYDLDRIYNLKNWARKLYSGLEVKADECDNCGICEPKCPYHVSIRKSLAETRMAF